MVLLNFPVLVHSRSEVFPILRRYEQSCGIVFGFTYFPFVLVSDMLRLQELRKRVVNFLFILEPSSDMLILLIYDLTFFGRSWLYLFLLLLYNWRWLPRFISCDSRWPRAIRFEPHCASMHLLILNITIVDLKLLVAFFFDCRLFTGSPSLKIHLFWFAAFLQW